VKRRVAMAGVSLHHLSDTLDTIRLEHVRRHHHNQQSAESLGEREQFVMNYTYIPGQSVPSFQVPTLMSSAPYVYTPTSDPSEQLVAPVVILAARLNESAAMQIVWGDTNSIDPFLQETPNNTQYLFGTYSLTVSADTGSPSALASASALAKENAILLRNTVIARMNQLSFPESKQKQLLANMHFIPQDMLQLEGSGSWISQWILAPGWQSSLSQMNVTVNGVLAATIPRADGRFDWVPSMSSFGNKSVSVAAFVDSCNGAGGQDLSGMIAITAQTSACDYFTQISSASAAKAAGIIIFAESGEALQEMNCQGNECNSLLSIPATMIDYASGAKLLSTVQHSPGTVNVSFQTVSSPAQFMAIDAQSKAQELGLMIFPNMRYLSWQAQWYNYQAEMLNMINVDSVDTTLVDVFGPTIMQGAGITVNLTVPPLVSSDNTKALEKLQLDMALSCPGQFDAECPPWDHTVQLFVCCGEQSDTNPLCGLELGRWITSFRRRIGRWLTDVTHLLPMLMGSESAQALCSFHMNTVPWAKPWKPSLSLRFVYRDNTLEPQPFATVPLYHFRRNFNSSYNDLEPVSFAVPSGTKRVTLSAVITGHGSDEFNCGEFCPTSHHFVVNDNASAQLNRTFSEAGSETGCADQTHLGGEPNEYGTWLYGRDGWCDGREVFPWVTDITSQLTIGSSNSVSYHGFYEGHTPNPTKPGAYIIMASYVTFYK
jgi:Peptide-N-glycosidase F, C terminal/Peptide-N-glycosidase F, N terminal